jgi:hypothetical protein
MMRRVAGFLVGVSICYSCGNAERASGRDSIAGTYVREYSREILNQISGNKLGMRTVRDTLYITSAGDTYKIENRKWSMNDYDNVGWQDMRHSESGPMPSFNASYDEASKTLKSEGGAVPSLVISNDGRLSVGNKSETAYAKID